MIQSGLQYGQAVAFVQEISLPQHLVTALVLAEDNWVHNQKGGTNSSHGTLRLVLMQSQGLAGAACNIE